MTKFYKDGDSLYSCKYILSFFTKYKRKVLNEDKRIKLKEEIVKISEKYKFIVSDIEITENQITLVVECNPKFGIYAVINKLKNGTANMLNINYPELSSKLPSIWTRSFYLKTVGSNDKEKLDEFMASQKKYENDKSVSTKKGE